MLWCCGWAAASPGAPRSSAPINEHFTRAGADGHALQEQVRAPTCARTDARWCCKCKRPRQRGELRTRPSAQRATLTSQARGARPVVEGASCVGVQLQRWQRSLFAACSPVAVARKAQRCSCCGGAEQQHVTCAWGAQRRQSDVSSEQQRGRAEPLGELLVCCWVQRGFEAPPPLSRKPAPLLVPAAAVAAR